MRVRPLLLILVAAAFPGMVRAQTSPSPIVMLAPYDVGSNPDANRMPLLAPLSVGTIPGGAVLAYRSYANYPGTYLRVRAMSPDLSRVAEAQVNMTCLSGVGSLAMYASAFRTFIGANRTCSPTYGVMSYRASPYVYDGGASVSMDNGVLLASGSDALPHDPVFSPDGDLGALAQGPANSYGPSVVMIRAYSLWDYSADIPGAFTSVPVGTSPRLSGEGVLVYSDKRARDMDRARDLSYVPELSRLWSVRLNTNRGGSIMGMPLRHPEALFATPRRIADHQIAWAGPGKGSLVVWQQRDGDDFNLYGLSLNAEGLPVGGPFAIATGPGHQILPQVTWMSNETYYVVWQEVRGGRATVRGQAVLGSETLLYGTAGESVDVSNGETACFPAIAPGGRLLAWTRSVGETYGQVCHSGFADIRGRWDAPGVEAQVRILEPVEVSGTTATVRARVRNVSPGANVAVYGPNGSAAMMRENDSTFVATLSLSGLPPLFDANVYVVAIGPRSGVRSESVTFRTGSGAPVVVSATGIPGSSYVSRLVMTPSGSGFAAVRDLGLYRYDGAVWQSLLSGLPDRNVTDIATDPADPARVLASTWATGLWSSVDAGLTWARVVLPPSFEQVRTVVFTREGTACLSGQGGVACRIGGAWEVRVPRRRLSSMLAIDGGMLGAIDDAVLVSTNLGETWEAVSAPGGTVAALAVTPARTWLAATGRGLFASADRGATWTQVPLPDARKEVQSVAVDPRTGAVYVTHSHGKIVRVSADLGSAQVIGTVAGALAVAVTSSGEVLVGTADGGLRQVSAPTGVAAQAVASTLGVAVWPTPSTAGARVRVTGMLSESVRAEIHDVTGRRVAVLQVDEATGEAVLPSLPSGVYLLRVQQGTRTATTAVVMR